MAFRSSVCSASPGAEYVFSKDAIGSLVTGEADLGLAVEIVDIEGFTVRSKGVRLDSGAQPYKSLFVVLPDLLDAFWAGKFVQ